jgi:branched-chain amino acid transport system permease protein
MRELLAYSILSASTYALVGIGLSLVLRMTRLFHFAHGAVFTAAAYACYLAKSQAHMPLLVAVAFGAVCGLALGCIIEVVVYRPLRERGAPPLVLLIASLGMYVVLQNVISAVFGDDIKSVRTAPVREGIEILGSRLTEVQLITICVGALVLASASIFLASTGLGRAMRAVASNPVLATACGMNINRVILWGFAIGSCAASIAGILVALDADMTPTMGMNFLMLAVVAVVVGGPGSMPGLALGSLLVAVAQLSVARVLGSRWQDAVALAILLVFLLLRPQGIMGGTIRKVTV